MRPTRTITIFATISLFIRPRPLAPGAPSGRLGYKHTAFALTHMASRFVLAKFSATFTPGAGFRSKLNKGGYHVFSPFWGYERYQYFLQNEHYQSMTSISDVPTRQLIYIQMISCVTLLVLHKSNFAYQVLC